MTLVDPGLTAAPIDARPVRRDPIARLSPTLRYGLYASVLVLILTTAEQLTDQTRLTSANTWSSALELTLPIALAGLGGLWAERAGIVNIGLEGMMVLGTWMGAWGGIEHGAWAGVVLGVVGGALGGLLHAIATVGFGVDHIISGVAVNILAGGVTQFANLELFDSTNQSPRIPENVGQVRVPGLNDVVGGLAGDLTDTSVLVWLAVSILGLIAVTWQFHPSRPFVRPAVITGLAAVAGLSLIELAPYLDGQQRFFVSEVGRIVSGLTDELSLVVVLGLLAFPISGLVLWRTKFGLRLRSVGEDPVAAESVGVNVYLMKVVAVVVSGAMAGLGGVSLVYLFAGQFRTGQTNGRGYIGLAAMIFGNWRPAGLALGAGLFGFTDALTLQSGQTTRALLVVVALGSVALVARALITGRWRSALIAVGAAVGAIVWFNLVDELPGEIVVFLPHLTTLLVLTFASQRLRPPAADGKPYRRGESG